MFCLEWFCAVSRIFNFRNVPFTHNLGWGTCKFFLLALPTSFRTNKILILFKWHHTMLSSLFSIILTINPISEPPFFLFRIEPFIVPSVWLSSAPLPPSPAFYFLASFWGRGWKVLYIESFQIASSLPTQAQMNDVTVKPCCLHPRESVNCVRHWSQRIFQKKKGER